MLTMTTHYYAGAVPRNADTRLLTVRHYAPAIYPDTILGIRHRVITLKP